MLRGEGGSWKSDAEFKFAKIQNSHVEGGWEGGLWKFDAQSKFAFKKKFFFAKNFLTFRAKSITVLFWTLSTKWFPYTNYRRTTIRTKITFALSFARAVNRSQARYWKVLRAMNRLETWYLKLYISMRKRKNEYGQIGCSRVPFCSSLNEDDKAPKPRTVIPVYLAQRTRTLCL